MKKYLGIVLALMLALSCVCGASAEQFTGSTVGFHGEVTVTLEIENNEIISAVVTGDEETAHVGSVAIEQMGERIVAANGTQVDGIAGATFTSNAVLRAANDAIAQSGATLTSKEVDTTSSEPAECEADVVVIGAGGAGMAAAATAAQNGANVIVLEKLSMPGGNTMVSGGFPNFVPADLSAEGQVEMSPAMEEMLYTKYLDVEPANDEVKALQDTVRAQYEAHKQNSKVAFVSPELQALYTYIGGGQTGDLELIKTFAAEGDAAFEWLISLPVLAEKATLNKGVFMNGIGNGGYWFWAGGINAKEGYRLSAYDKFIAPGLDVLESMGGRLVTNMTATELLVENNKVVGVKAVDKNGAEHVYKAGKGVILATGGFGANKDMVKEYSGIEITRTTDMKGTQGDGITMAVAIGAATVDMECVQLHMHGDPRTGLLSDVHGSTTNPIYVNKEGKRFVCENGTRAEISNATLEQTDAKMYSIFDSQNASDVIEAAVGTQVFKADTLEELATMAGVDAEQLVATVAEYNEAVANGTVDQLTPAKYVWGNAIDTAPFYCTPLAPTVHYTMGGLKIDAQAHVLAEDGSVIEGLYAAGEVTGGIHGNNRGAGQALADIVIFGHIAGESVTAE